MNEFNVEQHEKLLKEINQRILIGEKVDFQKELSHIFYEDNLAVRLRERLIGAVNGEISAKMKDRLSERQYFAKRDDHENEIIASEFSYAFFNKECTLEEIEQLNSDLIDKKTLMLCVISALRSYVNNEQQDDPKCLLLHCLYLRLKKALNPEIPFEEGDGFLEFVASKGQRAEVEKTRETGTVCLKCGSHNIASKGKEWQCRDCGKRFRKH